MIGTLVMNRFQVEDHLGGGGFGSVYRAWDRRLERHVAVKAVEVGGDTGRRILREAHAAARLNHPGIVTLYELGRENGVWLMVTELVEGGTLRDRCAAGKLSDREIAEVGADLCDALGHAHEQGIVHRDIKPQNVLVGNTAATAKLGDFGIGRLLAHTDVPQDGPRPAALAYLSPEQAAGAPGGPETDVYSLGLTLYECLAGRPGSESARLPLRRIRADLPRPLAQAIDACLDPHPARRPSLDRVAAAIEESLPALAAEPCPHPRVTAASLAASIAAATPTAIAYAAVLAGLMGAAAASLGLPGSLPLLLAAPLAAILSFARPERALLLGLAGVCAWLAAPEALPGAALAVAAAGGASARILRGSGRGLILPGGAPLLAAAGLALVIPLAASFAATARRRVSLSIAGLLCAAVAEGTLSRDLLPLVAAPEPDPGWAGSLTAAVSQVLFPLALQPGLWVLALLFAVASVWLGERLLPWLSRRGARAEAPGPRDRQRPALRSLPAGGGRGTLLP